MKYSSLFPKTKREAPSDEVAVNAKYLLRGGFIDKLMAGSYSLLPLGRLVERKIEAIVRQEMNETGAQEILMPLLHPKSIWNETGRWDSAREVMYQFKKDDKEFALSFTHEEIVLDLIRKHISTYRDFPIKLYHFSTKFRSELRAKSGILRGREFLMKDLYSVHTTEKDLNKYYDEIKVAYLKIFERLGLNALVVESGGGVFTDSITHEFQVLSEAGEDEVIYCPGGDFAQNTEICKVKEGKQCDLGHGPLKKARGIEVGNIFRFGTSYSEKMDVSFMNQEGKKKHAFLGSYGIGITRLIGVLVEMFHDDRGIIWPEAVAPFRIHMINIGNEKHAEKIYEDLLSAGIDVLWDDRDATAGTKFADADLIGIPTRIVISEKLGEEIEIKNRSEKEPRHTTIAEILDDLRRD